VVVSVDTSKPEVAAAAVEAGAEIINDVTGFSHPRMLELATSTGVGVVVMHMQGSPRTMQDQPSYVDVVAEVRSFLAERAQRLVEGGVDRQAVVVDPGIGFGKTTAHNLTLLNRLADLTATGFPVMVGPSRKSFLGAITGHAHPEDRDLATAVVAALAVERGAAVVRAHEPSSVTEAVKVATAIVRSED
jgi:dihydropteroate synthase